MSRILQYWQVQGIITVNKQATVQQPFAFGTMLTLPFTYFLPFLPIWIVFNEGTHNSNNDDKDKFPI
jgi:hypothetical protein